MPTMNLAAETATYLAEKAPVMCDFCSTPQPSLHEMSLFPCGTFVRRTIIRDDTLLNAVCLCHAELPVLPGDQALDEECNGPWAACATCAPLVAAENVEGVADRAMQVAKAKGHPDAVGLAIVAAHAGYWLHKEGARGADAE